MTNKAIKLPEGTKITESTGLVWSVRTRSGLDHTISYGDVEKTVNQSKLKKYFKID